MCKIVNHLRSRESVAAGAGNLRGAALPVKTRNALSFYFPFHWRKYVSTSALNEIF